MGEMKKKEGYTFSWELLQKPKEHEGVGKRSLSKVNATFLTNLGWCVLNEPNALWSRILRAKYYKVRCDIDMFEPKAYGSNVWKGITENAKTLGEGMRMVVGNESRMLHWDHKWVSDTPVSNLTTQQIPMVIAGANVEEMREHECGWKWDVFAPFISFDTLKLLQAYELKNNPSIGDLVYWKDGPKGRFSIKSTLQIMRHEGDTLDEIK